VEVSVEKIRKILIGMDALSEWFGRIFSWFIVAIILLSVFEVFTRRILGKPTIWTHEVLSYLFCASIMLTMAYTLRYKQHVSVDLIYARLTPKTKALLDIITFVIFLGFFSIVFLWEGIRFAATSWAMLERTPSAFNFYVFPAKTLLPIGVFLLLVQGLSDFIKNIVFVAKGEQL
jgi:TRAP-type mannitol/chloroaromatic compound transport system permease small subunit